MKGGEKMCRGHWVGLELANGRKILINTRNGAVETRGERDTKWKSLRAMVAVSDETELVFDDNNEMVLSKCVNDELLF